MKLLKKNAGIAAHDFEAFITEMSSEEDSLNIWAKIINIYINIILL